jgi:ubiquitin-protein ligase
MSKAPTIRRISREFENLQKDNPYGFSMKQLKDDDPYNWNAIIPGPEKSDYESCKYLLSVHYPFEYPFSPPVIKFISPIFHPNVSESGDICLNILKKDDGWSPVLSISKVLLSIQNLLMEPNPESALNIDAVLEKKKNPEEFKKKINNMYEKNNIISF